MLSMTFVEMRSESRFRGVCLCSMCDDKGFEVVIMESADG